MCEKLNCKITNMTIVNSNNENTVVLFKTKKNFYMKIYWVLFNIPDEKKEYSITIKIETLNGETIYNSVSKVNIDNSLIGMPNFNYQNNKSFSFFTEVNMNTKDDEPVLNKLRNNTLYKVSISFGQITPTTCSSYFLLKERD